MSDSKFSALACLVVVVAASSMACSAADQGTTEDSESSTSESNGEAVTGGDTCTIGHRSSSYDGTSPETTGCANHAVTKCSAPVKTSFGAVVGTVQLRYSTTCGTVWGKTVSNIGAAYLYTEVDRTGPSSGCTSTTCSFYSSSCTAEDHATSNYTRQLYDAASNLSSSARGYISTVSYNDSLNAIFAGYMNETCSY